MITVDMTALRRGNWVESSQVSRKDDLARAALVSSFLGLLQCGLPHCGRYLAATCDTVACQGVSISSTFACTSRRRTPSVC